MSNLNNYKNLPFEKQIKLPLNVQIKLSAAGHLKSPSGPAINTRPYGIPTYKNGRARGINTFNKNLNNSFAAIRRNYPQATAVPASTPSRLTIKQVYNKRNLTKKPVRVAFPNSYEQNTSGYLNPLFKYKGGRRSRRQRR